MSGERPSEGVRWRWLPVEGSWKYHLLLAVLGVLVLGPLAGVTAAYMNFSLGFFVGGQVLVGLLGSAVTAGYGAAGRHGANYVQTAAASVASMSGLGVLLQAMAWMGLPQPPACSGQGALQDPARRELCRGGGTGRDLALPLAPRSRAASMQMQSSRK